MAVAPIPFNPARERLERAHRVSAPARRPTRVAVDRHELVGELIDYQTLANDAMSANGAGLQMALRLPEGVWRSELQRTHHDVHDALVQLIARLRAAAGDYDRRDPA